MTWDGNQKKTKLAWMISQILLDVIKMFCAASPFLWSNWWRLTSVDSWTATVISELATWTHIVALLMSHHLNFRWTNLIVFGKTDLLLRAIVHDRCRDQSCSDPISVASCCNWQKLWFLDVAFAADLTIHCDVLVKQPNHRQPNTWCCNQI